MRAPLRLLVLVCVLTGCSSTPSGPRDASSTKRLDEEQLRGAAKADSLNPWPHYGLARLYAERGEYERAIFHYGACINRLPARSATRPMLELGILHQRLGNDAAARNCYQEVLETFPSDTRRFQTNPDFRLAALGLAYALKDHADAAARLAALKQRYLEEFHGKPADWGTRPPWMDEPLKRPRAK